MKYRLLTPGPTPVPESVRARAAEPILHHRTEEFGEIFVQVGRDLQKIFRTRQPVLIFSCSGTGAMESAVVNTMSPDETAVVAAGGVFGERWGKILQAFGVRVEFARAEWGHPIDPAEVRKALGRGGAAAKAVFVTHVETSTATLNDLKKLAEAVRDTEAILIVDAVSSLGGEPLETDAWGLDVVVSASQKGLMNAPGLGFVAVSQKGWNRVEAAKLPRFYWDWRRVRDAIPQKQIPFTPPVSLMAGQAEALRILLSEPPEMEKRWELYARMATATRAGVEAMGLKLFSRAPCNVLTAASLPAGCDGKALVRRLRQEQGISIAGGQEKLTGRIIRIAHMGAIQPQDIAEGLDRLEEMLPEFGVKTRPGGARNGFLAHFPLPRIPA